MSRPGVATEVAQEALETCVGQAWSIARAAGLDDRTAREVCGVVALRLAELAGRRRVRPGPAVLAWSAEVAHREVRTALLLQQWHAAAAGSGAGRG